MVCSLGAPLDLSRHSCKRSLYFVYLLVVVVVVVVVQMHSIDTFRLVFLPIPSRPSIYCDIFPKSMTMRYLPLTTLLDYSESSILAVACVSDSHCR